jgi:hypothetical protein
MSRSRLAVFAAAAVLIHTACGDETERSDIDSEMPATEVLPVAPRDVTAELVALTDLPVGGSIYIDGAGESPVISASLRGAEEGIHHGHVHSGTCEQPGPALVALQSIDTGADGAGEAMSTVDIPFATLTDGNHIVVYHEANGTPGSPIVCGAIPAEGG